MGLSTSSLIGVSPVRTVKPKSLRERAIKNFLDVFVLDQLDKAGKHGYGILQDLKTQTGIRIGPSALYPLLYELENRQLIVGEWESGAVPGRRHRRLYRITEKGERYKAEGLKGLSVLLPTLPSVPTSGNDL